MKRLIFILSWMIFVIGAFAITPSGAYDSVEVSAGDEASRASAGVLQNGYIIIDDANILSSSSAEELYKLILQSEYNSTNQICIATVRSLDGYEIEEFANELFRQLKLGQKDKNNGVLLLVAPNERRVRIEVGYGLEGVLTDHLSKKIINENILPHFKKGNYEDGIMSGAKAIVAVLDGGEVASENESDGLASSFFDKFGEFGNFVFIFMIKMVNILIIFYIFSKIISNIIKDKNDDRMDVLSASNKKIKKRHSSSDRNWDSPSSSGGGWSSSSSSSSSSDSSSGDGGSSGGGGASGDW